MAIDKINPFISANPNINWGSPQRVGKTQEPKQTPKVGGLEQHGVNGFVAKKWGQDLGGVPAGQPLGDQAIHNPTQLGRSGESGRHLNVDAFSLANYC